MWWRLIVLVLSIVIITQEFDDVNTPQSLISNSDDVHDFFPEHILMVSLVDGSAPETVFECVSMLQFGTFWVRFLYMKKFVIIYFVTCLLFEV